MTRLAVSGLSASLGGRQVLHGVSFDVAPGEFVGLIGPNGAGKSTLLRAVMGLLPYRGVVSVAGQTTTPAIERATRIAYLAQDRDIAWPMPVHALVALGRTPHLKRFAPLGASDRAAVEQAMQRMDVAAFRDRPATELSGGERARVLIARALAQQTPLLLADEPVSGLDPAHQIAVMRTFRKLADEGRGVIASLHDLGLAARWCTRLILLHEGSVAADGRPDALVAGEQIQSIFGIRLFARRIDGDWIVQALDTLMGDPNDRP